MDKNIKFRLCAVFITWGHYLYLLLISLLYKQILNHRSPISHFRWSSVLSSRWPIARQIPVSLVVANMNTTPSMYPTRCTPFTTITSRRWKCPWSRKWRSSSMCPSTRKCMCPLLKRCMCQYMSITRRKFITLKKIITTTTRAAGTREGVSGGAHPVRCCRWQCSSYNFSYMLI